MPGAFGSASESVLLAAARADGGTDSRDLTVGVTTAEAWSGVALPSVRRRVARSITPAEARSAGCRPLRNRFRRQIRFGPEALRELHFQPDQAGHRRCPGARPRLRPARTGVRGDPSALMTRPRCGGPLPDRTGAGVRRAGPAARALRPAPATGGRADVHAREPAFRRGGARDRTPRDRRS